MTATVFALLAPIAMTSPAGADSSPLGTCTRFDTDVFASGEWTRTGPSVFVKDGNLRIIPNWQNDDGATRTQNIQLPLEVESRGKLSSGGYNYRLPHIQLYFADGQSMREGYLSNGTSQWGGWIFNTTAFSFNENHTPPAEDVWMTVKMLIRADGGELWAKFDDETNFTHIVDSKWSVQGPMTKILVRQPWDADITVDYVRVTTQVDPAPALPLRSTPQTTCIGGA